MSEDPYYIVNGKYQCHDGTLMELCPGCRDDGVDEFDLVCDECTKRVCQSCWDWSKLMCYTCAKEKELYAPFKCSSCEETDPREKREYDCVVCRQELCDSCYSDKGDSGWDACDNCIHSLITHNTKNV